MRKLRMSELNRLSNEEFKAQSKNPVVVVLDNIRSVLNVGSVFRSSDAFLTQAIHLCGVTPAPPSREMRKTALGATESVDWQYFESTAESLQQLKEDGFYIAAIEQVDRSVSLENFPFSKHPKLALVFGNEVSGVSDEALALCDSAIEIPQFGTKHSFNISVSAGILLWEANRHRIQS